MERDCIGFCLKPYFCGIAGTHTRTKYRLGGKGSSSETDKGRVITELIAQGQLDANVAFAYRARYFAPRRLAAREILKRGVVRGELTKGLDLDLELGVDLIFAPLFYRLLVTGADISTDFLKSVVSSVLVGIKQSKI